jgi:mRNA interferase RelE/StbE
MRYDVILSRDAAEDLRHLEAHDRAAVRDALEIHLRHEPTKVSKSRMISQSTCTSRRRRKS